MKKLTMFVLFFTVLAFLIPSISLYAQTQAPDTVIVQPQDATGPVDALYRAILGDTTSTGARNNINRVYKLERGQIYLVDATAQFNFPVTIIADDTPASTQPPLIAPFPLADGSIPHIGWTLYKNATFKYLDFCGWAPNNQRLNGSDFRIVILGDSTRIVVDHCLFDGNFAEAMWDDASWTSVFIRDCEVRNGISYNEWHGNLFDNINKTSMDTLEITNCTDFVTSCYFVVLEEYNKYVKIDHNTIFGQIANPFFSFWLNNADVTNNIIYGVDMAGEDSAEQAQGWYDMDGLPEEVFGLDTLPSDFNTNFGVTKATRRVNFSNNDYYFPKQCQAFWDTNTVGVTAPVFMNSRTTAMFNNKTTWPNLTANNNTNLDPGFNSTVMTAIDSVMQWVYERREGGITTTHNYNPSGDPLFPGDWPVPENLSYTNSKLIHGGSDGYAVGDLNWFPEQRKAWGNGLTAVKTDKSNLPSNYSLNQNYPNPFNPSTIISYSIPKEQNVELTVYNVLGQLVSTLVNNVQSAGNHLVTFNANSLSSGIYFYTLKAGGFSQVRKMMLLK